MTDGGKIEQVLTDYIVTQVASRPPNDRPAPDYPIIESGLVDSLGLFKLISFIEDEFHVTIAQEDILFENFATIRAISDLVRAKRSAPQSERP